MAWTSSNPVAVGAATKKTHFDAIWDNADFIHANYLTGDTGTKAWFYQNVAPTGWTIDSTPADAVLAVKGGSQAFNVNGGTAGGQWTQPNHTHTTGDVTLTAAQSGLPAHNHGAPINNAGGATTQGINSGLTTIDFNTITSTNAATNASAAHNHGVTSPENTASTWRPLAQVGVICTRNSP